MDAVKNFNIISPIFLIVVIGLFSNYSDCKLGTRDNSQILIEDLGAGDGNLTVEITAVENIDVLRAQHPLARIFPLTASPTTTAQQGPIRYSLGKRVDGDVVVARGERSYVYPTLQDVQLKLGYPKAGEGAIVSFVEIVAQQTSATGNAYVIAGGIGQRSIQVVVEAKQTLRFSYQAYIYGYRGK